MVLLTFEGIKEHSTLKKGEVQNMRIDMRIIDNRKTQHTQVNRRLNDFI